jgi:Flp pilus assembly protein TadD
MNAPVNTPSAPSSIAGNQPRGWAAWCLIAVLATAIGWWLGWTLQNWSTSRLLTQARSLAMIDEKQAKLVYRKYLEYRPSDSEARLELADLLKRREPDAAFQELRLISPGDHRFIDAARRTAALAIDMGRDYDAVAPLVFLEQTFPEDAGVQLTLAELRFRERDFDSALKHARRSRELNSQEAQAWLVEAESLDELNRSAEMVEPLEAALRLDPELPQAHLNLAYAYQVVGREDEALDHVQWFLERFPQSAAAYRTLATVQRARGKNEEALWAVERSLELKPNQLDATLLEAELLLFLRRPEEAYHQLELMHAAHGPELRLLALLQRAAQLSGRKTEASEWQQRLFRLRPNGRTP